MVHLSEYARQFPNKPAALEGSTGSVTTFEDVDRESKQLAQYLAARGLVRGDVVAVLLHNSPRYLSVVWAARRSGFYLVPVSWHLTAAEAGYIVTNSGARALVAAGELADLADSIAAADSSALEVKLLVGANRPGFAEYGPAIADQPSEPLPDERNGTVMFYSSGTTGLPKGIKPPLTDAPFGAPGLLDLLLSGIAGADEDTIYLCPAPLYHAAPLGWSLAVQALGGCVLVMERFDPEAVLALIERHQVTHAQFVPTMFVRLLQLPEEVRQRYDLSSLRYVVHAAAPCPPDVKDQMIGWLGPIVHEYYAASEANCFFTIDSATWLAHRGSVGQALFGTPHILDEAGTELPPGEVGQIWIEGPSQFEYHEAPEQTAAAFNDRGWSTLGDVGWLDDDGFLYLSDRRTDLILVGGTNVYPREVEDVLATHPAVADVAVVGLPDDDMGQEVKAVVQPAPGVTAGPDLATELVAHCRAQLAGIKCPRSVDFADELPRLPTGKLLRRVVRDRFW